MRDFVSVCLQAGWPCYASCCFSVLVSFDAVYSSIGSRLKSALLSAPHTDHLFLSLLLLRLLPLPSRLLLRLVSPDSLPLSFVSALYFESSSAAIIAASSASGESSIVSSELMDGDLDLNELGVLGILLAEL